ncbi:hypothetical protein QY96_03111 [Bacillus thermotolerans]|uniref:Uncharacterized protein n=1 Tax=Bacillus thermotolerans TaxID=1221996 RepID=A0A0F5HP65_BACTR|nr:hypothetical protein QY95_03573 [Bacillus thermotolerans]KKB38149.1 hypothetical protein QY96_03111 [Bacillus thermotolerans]
MIHDGFHSFSSEFLRIEILSLLYPSIYIEYNTLNDRFTGKIQNNLAGNLLT